VARQPPRPRPQRLNHAARSRVRKPLQHPAPAREAPAERDPLDPLYLQRAPRLLEHQIQVVAGEVIAGYVVHAAAWPDGATGALAQRVDALGQPAGRRFEVGDGQHDPPLGPGDAGHLRDGCFGLIEVVDGSLAERCIEGPVGEGQRIGPGLDQPGNRPLPLQREAARQPQHA